MMIILIFAISIMLGVACAYIITTAVVGDGGPEWAWWTVAAVTYFIVASWFWVNFLWRYYKNRHNDWYENRDD